MEPILSVVCNEPSGPIERHVTKFVFSEENIKKFYEQSQKFPKIFGRTTAATIEEFLDMFFFLDKDGFWQTNNLFYIVDDFVGVLSLTNIYHPHDALMHFTFYDRRLKGRNELLREMIKYVIREYEFNRLSCEIPTYAPKTVLHFVSEHLGLVLEGKRRKSVPSLKDPEELMDVLLYGVTKGDIEQWERQKLKQSVVEVQPQ